MNNDILSYGAVFVVSYVIGGIPFGLLIGKAKGIDIRSQGSGNIGATNVGRCLGKPLGLFCFFLDFCKGAVPVLIVLRVSLPLTAPAEYQGIAAAVGTVCGHVFCPYLKFKGGKGIATAAGALCMLSWPSVVTAFTVWLVSLLIWRYVGLSSILAAAMLPLSALGMQLFCSYHDPGAAVISLFFVIAVLAIYKHRANIGRLLEGTEPKIGSKKKPSGEHA